MGKRRELRHLLFALAPSSLRFAPFEDSCLTLWQFADKTTVSFVRRGVDPGGSK